MSARPFSALNVMRKDLEDNSVFYAKPVESSEDRCNMVGFLGLETSRAAVFWISCSLEREYSGKPYSILLQESSREVSKAWIGFWQSSCDRYF